MKPLIAISLKRAAISHMQAVNSGKMSREEAKSVISKRYYASTREELIEELTRRYDKDCVVAFHYFELI